MAEDQVARINVAVRNFVARLVRQLGINITSNLIQTTPVDTGWARANWIPSLGSPVEEASGIRPSDGRPVDSGAQREGMATVLHYSLDRGNLFITNNVPYIMILDLGHSSQAPAGFVRAAIERALEDAFKVRGQ